MGLDFSPCYLCSNEVMFSSYEPFGPPEGISCRNCNATYHLSHGQFLFQFGFVHNFQAALDRCPNCIMKIEESKTETPIEIKPLLLLLHDKSSEIDRFSRTETERFNMVLKNVMALLQGHPCRTDSTFLKYYFQSYVCQVILCLDFTLGEFISLWNAKFKTNFEVEPKANWYEDWCQNSHRFSLQIYNV